MNRPNWLYDEFRHFGVDFANEEEVRAYDSKQGTTIEKESQLVADLQIQPDHSLLEFGCGTGCFAIAAAQRCRSVRAVDISKAMLDYVSSRAAGLGLENLETFHAGFLSYEHTGDPVDWIVTKYALHHLPDAWKAVALTRMYDCLAAGGALFLRDVIFSFPLPEYAKRELRNYLMAQSNIDVAIDKGHDVEDIERWIDEGVCAFFGSDKEKFIYRSSASYAKRI